MRLSAKLLLTSALLIGFALPSFAYEGEAPAAKVEDANKQPKKPRSSSRSAAKETRRQIRRYSFRGGVKFSPRGYGVYPNREATSKARADYAPFHGGNYIQ